MKTLTFTVDHHTAFLAFDRPGSRVNTITRGLISEVEEVLETIAQDDHIKAVILHSAKESGFLAGVDLQIFRNFKSHDEALAFSQQLGQLLNRINTLSKPVIAAMHGAALGAGLDTALACHYRIATDHPDTKFGFPEVTLGLSPCGGGTQRLPAQVGLTEALPLLYTGKQISSRRALQIGLVDELIHEHGLVQAAKNVAQNLITAANKSPGSVPLLNRGEKPIRTNPVRRQLVFSRAEKEIRRRTRGLLPAPRAILNCVKHGLKHGTEKGLTFESETFAGLSMTTQSRHLVRGTFAKQSARNNPSTATPREVRRIGVIGAGLMGCGITSVSIQHGFGVTLKDRNISRALRGIQTSWHDLDAKVQSLELTGFDRDRMISGIHSTDRYDDLKHIPLVVEAVLEDVSTKQSVLQDVESIIRDDAIFATTTSAIPISNIAGASRRPERVIGMHYFSPAQKMPLVEIIKGKSTTEEVVATAADIVIRQGKYVIVVGDAPGFYVSRIVIPMINEAMLLIEEGADIRIIDTAMKNFGFPVGPVMLVDEVGIDVVSHVMETMNALFRKRGITFTQAVHRLHESGFAGRKNRRGFYDYRSEKKLINDDIYRLLGGTSRKDFTYDEIMERISLVMINEAVHCLQDQIIQNPKDGDIGAVLGMGFPAFRGGPFRYLENTGLKRIWDRLEYRRNLNGERFKPAPLMADYLKNGKTFYP